MVFKWKISRPAFHSAANGAEVMHPGIETEFETGSVAEAHGIFTDSKTALAELFGNTLMAGVSGLALIVGGDTGEAQGEQTGSGETGAVETEKQRKARERKEKKNNNDPAGASAPDPVTIPGTEAPPTAPATADDGIPEALRRTAPPAAAVAPPPLPVAPPAPPAAPPTGVLAGKIAAELDKRAVGAPDGGQALADWLATSGITVKGATYAEATTVLRLQPDEKLAPIAAALGVA